ncbi:MAG: molybdenum cofactor guanylyltransferase [Planctomycetaceae bacterium]|nr:MAG: molybdenum cofactor guanylyltransferase [Planctomycetaceae bacterium]
MVSLVTSPVIVVAARDQPLPPLPSETVVVFDEREACGPLAGLTVGLKSLVGKAETAFLTSCDSPLLVPAFVSRMAGLLADDDLVLPQVGKNLYPLAAVYRVSLWLLADRLLEAGQRRLLDLAAMCRSRPIDPAEFQDIDPRFDSLRNINTPADYAELLAEHRPLG